MSIPGSNARILICPMMTIFFITLNIRFMKFRFIFYAVLLFLSNGVFSQTLNRPDNAIPIAEFATTPSGGSYTIPATNGSTSITQVLVRIWGGGGNGATSNGNSNKAIGGGGGAFVTFVIPKAELDKSRVLSIVVGGRGQLSSVTHNATLFIANPGSNNGNGGPLSSTNPSSLYTFYNSTAGGRGDGGESGQSGNGAGGGSGKLTADGENASNQTPGQGERSNFGTGGAGNPAINNVNNGVFPGGGGSGSANGAGGAVYIYDFSTGALPVTLSSFTAKQTTDNNVSLAWVTSSESVNKGFSIERQEEGNGKFQSLGFIPSKAEGGNSQTTLAYSFKDMTPKKGTNMYRLVQEDLDGTKTYSEVRIVKLNNQSVSMVFPNPSNGSVNISRTADGKKMNIQVIDQSGKVISQMNNITDANYKLNIQKSGVYTIKMTYPETGEQSIQRVVVQK
jgi:hypothetical protein